MTLSLTFDNLGEAAELELGVWPAERPVGAHPSVTCGLPRVLDLLGDDLRSTFFVEGWSATVYPEAIRGIVARGHEIAAHGWRHERWRALTADDERSLLKRSRAAFADLGIVPGGFRPPGGLLAPHGAGVLHDADFFYCSAAGSAPGWHDAVVSLPFDWRLVDATWLDPVMAPVRRYVGMPDDPPGVAAWRAALETAVARCRATGDWRAIVLHPYLLVDDAAFGVLADLVTTIRADDALAVLPCGEVAAAMA